MNSDNARKVPTDAPTEFIKPRWQKLVMTDTGIDRRYYELCALSELKNALRSGDIWVQGSRQFKDFEDYGAAREIRQPQAGQRIAAGRGHRLRPVPA